MTDNSGDIIYFAKDESNPNPEKLQNLVKSYLNFKSNQEFYSDAPEFDDVEEFHDEAIGELQQIDDYLKVSENTLNENLKACSEKEIDNLQGVDEGIMRELKILKRQQELQDRSNSREYVDSLERE